MRKIDGYKINILDRTKNFGAQIIKLSGRLPRNPSGYTIADQLVRAGTSIGSNLIEAQEAVSKKDFLYKMSFCLKEAKETKYWLELIKISFLVDEKILTPVLQESEEIVKILISTLIKLKSK